MKWIIFLAWCKNSAEFLYDILASTWPKKWYSIFWIRQNDVTESPINQDCYFFWCDNRLSLFLLCFEPIILDLFLVLFVLIGKGLIAPVQSSDLCPSNFLKQSKQKFSWQFSQVALSVSFSLAGELHLGQGRYLVVNLESVSGLKTFAALFGVFSKIDCAKSLDLFWIPIFSCKKIFPHLHVNCYIYIMTHARVKAV